MKEQLLQRINSIVSDPTYSVREVLFQLKNLLYESDFEQALNSESKDISLLINNNIGLIQKGDIQQNFIRTGFTEFDAYFGGFAYGEFVVIGGRPSMGKTQLLVNLSINISQKMSVLYFSFDLSEASLTSRFISSVAEIPIQNLLQYKLTTEERKRLGDLEGKFDRHKIFINDSCNNSVSAFKRQCIKHIKENGVKVIIVDYLQLMSSNRYRNSRDLEISFISQELKSVAKEYNVCVIASSQLSRAVESRSNSRRPLLTDLRDSGGIEQNADKVIFLYRPEYYGLTTADDGTDTEGMAELMLAKNRNGLLGSIKIFRDANFTNFKDFVSDIKEFNFFKNRISELEDGDDPF